MKRNTNSILMLAYISFIFVSVFSRKYYDSAKWNHISAAINVASAVIVLSDILDSIVSLIKESIASTKENMQSLLSGIRQNLTINTHLDTAVFDNYGNSTGETIKDLLGKMDQTGQNMLKRIEQQEKMQRVFEIAACGLLYIGFVTFFCILLFEPFYNKFSNRLDEISVLAFGMILAGQYFGNAYGNYIHKTAEDLNLLVEDMTVINKTCEKEAVTHAD